MDGALDNGVRCIGVHKVEHGMDNLVAANPEYGCALDLFGCEQQIKTEPGSGMSAGSVVYSTSPSWSPLMQVWQMPDRQL